MTYIKTPTLMVGTGDDTYRDDDIAITLTDIHKYNIEKHSGPNVAVLSVVPKGREGEFHTLYEYGDNVTMFSSFKTETDDLHINVSLSESMCSTSPGYINWVRLGITKTSKTAPGVTEPNKENKDKAIILSVTLIALWMILG